MKQGFHCKTEEHETFGSGKRCFLCFPKNKAASMMGKLSHTKSPRGDDYFLKLSKLGLKARQNKAK